MRIISLMLLLALAIPTQTVDARRAKTSKVSKPRRHVVSHAKPDRRAKAQPKSTTAIWRVSDSDTEIILFGTLHKLRPGTKWLTERVLGEFDRAGTLVVEVDIPDDPYVLEGTIRRLGFRTGLPLLIDRVTPSNRKALKAAVVQAKLPMASLDNMQSWFAAVTIEDVLTTRAGFRVEAGADFTLTARARSQGKTIIGLETIDQQLGFFNDLSDDDQRLLLDNTVAEAKTAIREFDRLIAAWQAGDTVKLAANYEVDLGKSPKLLATLVTDRNARWADWIQKALQQPGKVFVAVGAGHLAGKSTVQDYLMAKGLKVERIP